jgi:N-acetylated-alpha-linked acidic dipeptidase
VREAIEAGRWDEANRYAAVTAERLAAYAEGIERATALISGGK